MEDYQDVSQAVGTPPPDVRINGNCKVFPSEKKKDAKKRREGEEARTTVTFRTDLREVELVFPNGEHPFEEGPKGPPFIVRSGEDLTLTVRDEAVPEPGAEDKYPYCPTDSGKDSKCPDCDDFPIVPPPKMIIRGVA